MKRQSTWAAAILAMLVPGMAHAQTIQVSKNNRTIAVTATDSASAPADIARISVGFQVFAPSAAAAYQHGSQVSGSVAAALKKAGVADRDIQSQSQTLSRTDFPDNNVPPAERAQRQFTLSQSWIVTAPAKEAATVLRDAIEAGANQSGNIDWDLSSRGTLQAKAAAKALLHAHAIARQMAAGLGVQLGPLIYASNQAPERRFPMLMAQQVGAMSPAAEPAPLAIHPRHIEETATVHAVFSIE